MDHVLVVVICTASNVLQRSRQLVAIVITSRYHTVFSEALFGQLLDLFRFRRGAEQKSCLVPSTLSLYYLLDEEQNHLRHLIDDDQVDSESRFEINQANRLQNYP